MVRYSQGRDNNKKAAKEPPPEVPRSADPVESDGAAIAAVAVALALSLQKEGAVPPGRAVSAVLPSGASAGSAWAVAGREQLMCSRGKVGHKWGRRSE
jgi:hypothetical protein